MNEIHTQLEFKAVRGLEGQGGKVRVPALLFRAGEYPDKGVTVTPSDLAALVAAFNAAGRSVPVKAEHLDSPLDPLGEVVVLHLEGDELFGVLTFSTGIYRHLEERGAYNLSVKLLKDETGLTLAETSIVFAPRVPGAGFLTAEQVGAKMAQFRAAGKITPAMEPRVQRLLSAPLFIAFSDGSSVSVAAEVEALINTLPIVQPRGNSGAIPVSIPTAPQSSPQFSGNPDILRWAMSLGLDPAHIAKESAH